MEPDDYKKWWSYGAKLPQGSWTWKPIDTADGFDPDDLEDEFDPDDLEELRDITLSMLTALAVDLEIDLLDEIDRHVRSTEPAEAQKMLEDLFRKA